MQVEERTIRYELTRKDILAFQVRALSRHRLFVGMLVIFYLTIVWVDSRPVPGHEVPLAMRLIIGILAGLVALLSLGFIGAALLVLLVRSAKHKNVLGEHSLSLTDEGLLSKSATGEGLLKWCGIHKVVSTPKYLIIYLNESMAKLIPKRAFLTIEAAAAFEQEIRRRTQSN